MSRSDCIKNQPEIFKFTAKNSKAAKAEIAKYPKGWQESAVMPLLDLAQRQNDGWLSRAAIDTVSKMLSMAPIRVYEVATFYTMYNLEPIGKHHVQICTNLPCWLRGSENIVHTCKKFLAIDMNMTTKDRKFTLSEVECLGACANAPMMQIGDDYYEDLDAQSTRKILEELKVGNLPKTGSQTGRQRSKPVIRSSSLTTQKGDK
jgi:NADH-quinone oxidoreductase E subunit